MIHLPPDAPGRALPISGHDQRVLEPEKFSADAAAMFAIRADAVNSRRLARCRLTRLGVPLPRHSSRSVSAA